MKFWRKALIHESLRYRLTIIDNNCATLPDYRYLLHSPHKGIYVVY